MKNLKTYIKLILKEEDEMSKEPAGNKEITFGDLKKLLRMMQTEKITKSGLKAIAGLTGKDTALAALDALDMISKTGAKEKVKKVAGPIIKKFKSKFSLGADKSPEKVLAKLWGLNDLEGARNLSIPNELSNLIDDNVEAEFIVHLLSLIENEDDNKVLEKGWVVNNFKEFTKSNEKTSGAFASKS